MILTRRTKPRSNFPSRDHAKRVGGGNNVNNKIIKIMITSILAEITGSIHVALGCCCAALGVGFVGAKAVEAVGRNPGAFGKVLVLAILGMALAEAIAFYVLFLA